MNMIRRAEYPRPQFQREEWMTLNGMWDFAFKEVNYQHKICVPFSPESKLSGIHHTKEMDCVWYRRTFKLPIEWTGKNIILHFGAVDYECKVWVNGKLATQHIGGQTSFQTNITELLIPEENELTVWAKDYHKDLDIPRGKQFWKEQSESIFYTATTGIWQSVWLEPVNEHHIKNVLITPLFDEKSVKFEYELDKFDEYIFETELSFQNNIAGKITVNPVNRKGCFVVKLDEKALGCWNVTEDLAWTPENPRLFDVKFRLLQNNQCMDEVKSYFGMRKVSVENGKFLLNNRPYYQRLILDQGYWPEGNLTAPSDDAFIEDIQYTKAMGFNGVRKHQKVEDPRYLYHADRLGLLVWGEIGSGYTYSRDFAQIMMKEWTETVLSFYNHPCVVALTPLNESWGTLEIAYSEEQQNFCKALYAMTKALDITRPISDNDGWEHIETDLLTIHDYESNRDVLKKRYQSLENILHDQPAGRAIYIKDGEYQMQPIIISEFGGISFELDGIKGWGYSSASSEEDFLKRYADVVTPLIESEHVQGFCYTQLTDVEQEVNGLLTYDRKPKANIEEIYKITCGIMKIKE